MQYTLQCNIKSKATDGNNSNNNIPEMQIKLQKYEYLQEKLSKLKCSQGCQSNANYIVYQTGLLCTICLSKLGDIPPDHLASLQDLAKTIAELTETYQKNNKQGHNLLPLKAEIQNNNKIVKGLRDSLTVDVKAIHSKTNHHLTTTLQNCIQNSRNDALQNLFEPDLTASLLASQQELLIANLSNLQVNTKGEEVSYEFKQQQKDPEQAKKQSLQLLHSIDRNITQNHQKLNKIMSAFRQKTKQ